MVDEGGMLSEILETFRVYRGFPKTRGTLLGVPIIRTIVFGGL